MSYIIVKNYAAAFKWNSNSNTANKIRLLHQWYTNFALIYIVYRESKQTIDVYTTNLRNII